MKTTFLMTAVTGELCVLETPELSALTRKITGDCRYLQAVKGSAQATAPALSNAGEYENIKI